MAPQPGPRPLTAVVDPIQAEGVAILRAASEVVLLHEGGTPSDTVWGQVDALVVRTSPVAAGLLARCPRLKVVGKHGTGVDNVDLAAASAAGIAVFNTPGANALAVAEGAVALMLAVVKRLRDAHDLVADGRFAERGAWRAGDLSGRTLALIGGGRIAGEVARICGRGFGMRVLVYDPHASYAQAEAMGGVKFADLDELLQQADFVSVHVPLTEETRGLLGAERLARLKRSAILVNTARGGIVDEAALAAALQAGRLGGAGLDVFEQEPPARDNPLFTLPNVVLSPHVAGITEESARRMAIAVAQGVADALAGKQPASTLNPEIWERRRR